MQASARSICWSRYFSSNSNTRSLWCARLKERFKELADNPKNVQVSLAIDLQLDDDFQKGLKSEAADLLKMLKEMRVSLNGMVTVTGLSMDERHERRVWMLARALYKQELENPVSNPTGGKINPDVKGASDKSKSSKTTN